jgi:hypothetical protein
VVALHATGTIRFDVGGEDLGRLGRAVIVDAVGPEWLRRGILDTVALLFEATFGGDVLC